MPIKNLILLILFGQTLNLSSQSQNLIFKLEGHVYAFSNNKKNPLPLGDVLAKLVVDGKTIAKTFTDSLGFYVFEFDSNGNKLQMPVNNFVVEASAFNKRASDGCHYFGSRGVESTIGIVESTLFIKDFQLFSPDCCDIGPFFPIFYFEKGINVSKSNDFQFDDSLKYVIQIIEENPTIVIEVACHTNVGEANADKVSKGRAEFIAEQLIENGINEKRIVPVGYGDSRPIFTISEMSKMSEMEVKTANQKNNRCVIRILSFDFNPDSQ